MSVHCEAKVGGSDRMDTHHLQGQPHHEGKAGRQITNGIKHPIRKCRGGLALLDGKVHIPVGRMGDADFRMLNYAEIDAIPRVPCGANSGQCGNRGQGLIPIRQIMHNKLAALPLRLRQGFDIVAVKRLHIARRGSHWFYPSRDVQKENVLNQTQSNAPQQRGA